ncbi:phage tail protein [Nocardioides hwasunensis]|uniref:Phage tail protein n=1 Tax=Nocardioides hwasunensis TaxID=397258 RepID=A0ABR8MGX8_9ACTN|nr:tail fiber protein [Nocardioides hwasunensis]MBD3915328.1 phage tail protein [Nocardioides hwasunensis]
MSEPYIGELKILAFSYAPRGWALCNGQMLPINQNQALFAVLGVQYGGNGVTTFALPDLRGRVPVHPGAGLFVGQSGGEAAHQLTVNEMPAHTHAAQGSSAVTNPGGSPTGAVWAAGVANSFGSATGRAMSPAAVATSGSGAPFDNRPPFLALNWAIALTGIYPSRS